MKSTSNSCLFSFVGLSLATSPFIISLLTIEVLVAIMTEWGKMSEELFRPERLPTLHFPELDRD